MLFLRLVLSTNLSLVLALIAARINSNIYFIASQICRFASHLSPICVRTPICLMRWTQNSELHAAPLAARGSAEAVWYCLLLGQPTLLYYLTDLSSFAAQLPLCLSRVHWR